MSDFDEWERGFVRMSFELVATLKLETIIIKKLCIPYTTFLQILLNFKRLHIFNIIPYRLFPFHIYFWSLHLPLYAGSLYDKPTLPLLLWQAPHLFLVNVLSNLYEPCS